MVGREVHQVCSSVIPTLVFETGYLCWLRYPRTWLAGQKTPGILPLLPNITVTNTHYYNWLLCECWGFLLMQQTLCPLIHLLNPSLCPSIEASSLGRKNWKHLEKSRHCLSLWNLPLRVSFYFSLPSLVLTFEKEVIAHDLVITTNVRVGLSSSLFLYLIIPHLLYYW